MQRRPLAPGNKKTGNEIAAGPGKSIGLPGPLAISLKWLQADRQITTGGLHSPLGSENQHSGLLRAKRAFPFLPHLRYGQGMQPSTFTILLGGNLLVTDRLRQAVSGSRFIAADSGMRHAQALNVVPELWVGDFDSTSAALLAAWPDVAKQPYAAAKAETDGEIAISQAITRGAKKLILAGALGGERSDHALQHLLYAVDLAEQGFEVVLTSGEEEGFPLLAGEKQLDLLPDTLFSVLGLTRLDGLDIGNARYPLKDFSLAFGSSRTISNIAKGPVRLSLKQGKAIVLARPYDFTGA
jgi:thiamine pyrophosphokinase